MNLTGSPTDTEGGTIPPGSIVIRRGPDADGHGEVHSAREKEIELPDPLIKILSLMRRQNKNAGPDSLVFVTGEGDPIYPNDIRLLRIKRIGRELDVPWLSWQVLRRAHEALLCDLRSKLAADLVLGGR